MIGQGSAAASDLVGHWFRGLVSLSVALRGQAALASLTIFEAPAVGFLRGRGDEKHYDAFRSLTDGNFAAYRAGNREAISAMIDFYGGPARLLHGRRGFGPTR